MIIKIAVTVQAKQRKNHYNSPGVPTRRNSDRYNMSDNERLHDIKHAFVDLADERMGTKAIYSTDDFFAPMENMLKPAEPISIPGKYTEHGKWMDGWESRRKRNGDYDYSTLR